MGGAYTSLGVRCVDNRSLRTLGVIFHFVGWDVRCKKNVGFMSKYWIR